ncbi:MAG: ornithine carbamoyltransferase [Armatimonadetes bacterium]|nr:ornithine carbamoyltransferase [Armatimonadota bacterium]
MVASLRGRDFISMDDLSVDELNEVLDFAVELKRRVMGGDRPALLQGKVLAMLFEKPSLRTRVTFEVGMLQLGGHAIYLGPSDVQMGSRESVADVARNLERWVDGIMARTFAHRTVEELAEHAGVPVINGLSDLEHPCQTVADLLTIRERVGEVKRARVAWVGDGNNVCHSLLLGAAKLGIRMSVATPAVYAPDAKIVARAEEIARQTGGSIAVGTDPQEAVRDAKVINTDVWVSMGQESERATKLKAFAGFQVNADLVRRASRDVVVLHCLPAHRGEEITDDVLDGPHSAVFDQAENRLHAQKALLAKLL